MRGKFRLKNDAPPELIEGDLDENSVLRWGASYTAAKRYADTILEHDFDFEDFLYVSGWAETCLDEAPGHSEHETWLLGCSSLFSLYALNHRQ